MEVHSGNGYEIFEPLFFSVAQELIEVMVVVKLATSLLSHNTQYSAFGNYSLFRS